MSSFEWIELQTLTNEIDTSRARLADARARKDLGRARRLEDEIARAEKRRTDLLAHITTNLVNAPEPAPPPAKESARARRAAAPVEESAPVEETAPVETAAEREAAEAVAEPEPAEAVAEPEPAEAVAEPEPAEAVSAPE